MKILKLESEGNQEMLQEVKNKVDKCTCFQGKIQGLQEFFRPFLPLKHVYTPFSPSRKYFLQS